MALHLPKILVWRHDRPAMHDLQGSVKSAAIGAKMLVWGCHPGLSCDVEEGPLTDRTPTSTEKEVSSEQLAAQ